MSAMGSVLLVIVLFGITIFVHELGHFLVARWCGLVVDVFSIGFGPAIWKRKRKGIVYKIGCIPVGGYVALPQLDPTGMSLVQGKPDASGVVERKLPPVAAWKKILVAFAGGTGNVLFAVLTAWLVYWIGMPAGPDERSTKVGFVSTNSVAFREGLRAGDEVLAVNDAKVRKWSDVRVEAALNREVRLLVRTRTGQTNTVTLATQRGALGVQTIGGVEGLALCSVLEVDAGTAADRAGIRPGDTILEFAGEKVLHSQHLVELVAAHRDEAVPIMVRRVVDGRAQEVTTALTPAMDVTMNQVRIGIKFNPYAIEFDTVAHPSVSEQMRSHAGAIFRFLRALRTPKEAKAALNSAGGPVAIAATYWALLRTSLMLAIWFTGMLNVNLAIVNLLPIPVLDGGHIVFSLWEGVTRRPVNARFANALINASAALIIAFLAYVSFRDMDRFTPAVQYVRDLVAGKTNAVERAGAGGGAPTNRPGAPAATPAAPTNR
jgi:regulator of sigma E protease